MTSSNSDSHTDSGDDRRRPTRRTFLKVGAAGLAGALLVGRACFYPHDQWTGRVLGQWEAAVVAAAAGTFLPGAPPPMAAGPTAMGVARNVDHFLVGLPDGLLLQIHGMLGLIEHATILGGHLQRFTRLDVGARRDLLADLHDMGGKLALAARGLRDLCLMGWYQDERTWAAIGYDGPLVDRPAPPAVVRPEDAGAYADLVAPPGATPEGAV